MNTRSRIIKNSSWLMLFQLFGKIISFFTIIIIVRALGAMDFGKYSIVLVIVTLVSAIASLGLDQLIIRDIAKNNDSKYDLLVNVLIIKIFSSVFAIAVCTIIGVLLKGISDTFWALVILSISIPFNMITNLSSSIYFGLEKMLKGAFFPFMRSIITLFLVSMAIILKGGLLVVVLAYSAANVISAIISGIIVISLKLKRLKRTYSWGKKLVMIKEAFPFVVLGFSLLLYYKIDIIILSILKNEVAVGEYSASYKILNALIFIPAAITGALFPTLSKLNVFSRKELKSICNHSLKYLIMIGLPITMGISILSIDIISLVYGKNWYPSAMALQILIWSWGLICVNCICNVTLNAIGKTLINIMIILIGTILNIFLNFILIPPFGINGASAATVATEFFITFLYFYFTIRYVSIKNPFQFLFKPFIASLIMMLIIFMLSDLNVLLLILVGALIYFLSLLALGALKKSELKFLGGLVST